MLRRYLLTMALTASRLCAQPAFEAASVKLNTDVAKGTGSVNTFPGGRLRAENALVRMLLQDAFDVRPFELVGGPSWIDSARYDIDAKAEGNPTRRELLRMLRTLMEDRFQLRAHTETRETPVYTLSAAKGGLKLSASKEKCEPIDDRAPSPASALGKTAPCGRFFARLVIPKAQLDGVQVAMPGLVRLLSNLLWRPVIDKTGYTGTFDAHLDFAADDALGILGGPYRPDVPLPPEHNEPGAQSIYTAMREQLGLKLESARGPVEMIVIDRIERASEN
jgi:uncharacterized protein (TIGR03435 family)